MVVYVDSSNGQGQVNNMHRLACVVRLSSFVHHDQ